MAIRTSKLMKLKDLREVLNHLGEDFDDNEISIGTIWFYTGAGKDIKEVLYVSSCNANDGSTHPHVAVLKDDGRGETILISHPDVIAKQIAKDKGKKIKPSPISWDFSNRGLDDVILDEIDPTPEDYVEAAQPAQPYYGNSLAQMINAPMGAGQVAAN